MTPTKQRNLHRPGEGVWGDCHSACLASMLDLPLDDVPHFGEGGPDGQEFNRRVREWLSIRGLGQASAAFEGELDAVLRMMRHVNPGVYYILGGRSLTGVNHSVVALENRIVHDPSLNESGIVRPCEDGFYWVTFLVCGATVETASVEASREEGKGVVTHGVGSE